MPISKEDKFKAYYFGQMTIEDLADFKRKLGENEDFKKAYEEYSILQGAFLAEEYVRNYSDTGPISAAEEEELYLYVEGEITSPERIAAVEARIKTDEVYREEYEMMKDVAMMDIYTEEDDSPLETTPMLTAVSSDGPPKRGEAKVRQLRPKLYRRLGVAAAILVLLALGWQVWGQWAFGSGIDQGQVASLLKAENQEGINNSKSLDHLIETHLAGGEDVEKGLLKKASIALEKGAYTKAEALLLKVDTLNSSSWRLNAGSQQLLISLVMRNAVDSIGKRQLAFSLIDKLESTARAKSVYFGNENDRAVIVYAPLMYKRALLLSLQETNKQEALEQLEAILEMPQPLKEYKEKASALRSAID